MPLECRVEPLGLDLGGASVVVLVSVDQQKWLGYLIGKEVRGHLDVGILGLPDRPLLRLESKGSQGSVVCPAPRDAATEEVWGMGEEVGGHEGAV